MKTRVNHDVYRDACRQYQGWCTACQDFTRDMTEPDATEYDCPECRGLTVVGAEQAFIEGIIEVLDADCLAPARK
jgi:Zn finger protein HypA/HybF involved in hydrogenase expression